MNRILSILLICISLPAAVNAQVMKATSFYSNVKEGVYLHIMDSAKGLDLSGAYIRVLSGTDTIGLVADERGFIRYDKYLKDSVKLMVDYMGYEQLEAVVSTPAGLDVYLAEKKQNLSEIIVRGEVIAVVTKGDTVQFNTAGFKTMEGDMISRLFEKLSGMKIDVGQLTYMGERIDRITVDNQRLFSDNVMLALDNLKASDVEKVKVYKVEGDWEKLNEFKNTKQLTVADVTTKSKLSMVRMLHLPQELELKRIKPIGKLFTKHLALWSIVVWVKQ